MATIDYKNDKTRAHEQMEGSDGRANVSSRSDSRAYYNSRDQKQTYSVTFDHQSAVAGEFSVYVENTSKTLDLVISEAVINSVEFSRVKMWFVSGTAAGGTELTPTNLNKGSSNDSDSLCRQGDSGDSITGLTTIGQIALHYIPAANSGEISLHDTVRLGQNDAIAIQYAEGTTGDFAGHIDMFFE